MVKWGLVLKDSQFSLPWILLWLHYCCHTVQLTHLKCTYSCIYAIVWISSYNKGIFDSLQKSNLLEVVYNAKQSVPCRFKGYFTTLIWFFFGRLTSTDFKAFSFFISRLLDFDLLKIVRCKAPKWSQYKLTTLAASLRPGKGFQT